MEGFEGLRRMGACFQTQNQWGSILQLSPFQQGICGQATGETQGSEVPEVDAMYFNVLATGATPGNYLQGICRGYGYIALPEASKSKVISEQKCFV